MYHETSADDVRRALDLPDGATLDAAIMLGTANTLRARDIFLQHVSDPHLPERMPCITVAKAGGVRVGIGITYGATMNVDVLRFFQILGARRVVQCGYFGGLQTHMKRADFIVPSSFVRHDGASDAYLPRDVQPSMDAQMTKQLVRKLHGHPVHFLPQLSIVVGIASETQQHIDDWSAAGYGGVDLEFASTAAVCHRYGIAFTGLLLCSDVPVANESIFGPFEGEARRVYEDRRQLMFKIAVELVAQD